MGYAVDLSHEDQMYASDSFATYAEAVDYVDEVVDAWEGELGMEADRSLASQDNMYAARCGDRTAQVVRDDSLMSTQVETHALVSLEQHGHESYWWICSCGNEGGPYPTYNAAWDSWVDCPTRKEA